MTRAIRYGFVLPVVIQIFLLLSCRMAVVEIEDFSGILDVDGSDSVYKLNLNNKRNGAIILNELENKDVFLVMVNTTNSAKNASAAPSSSVSGEVPVAIANGDDIRVPAGFVTVNGETLVRYERQTQILPPTFPLNKSLRAMRSAASGYKSAQEGDTKTIYADVSNPSDVPTPVTATLKKIGTYCKIWVADTNFDHSSGGDNDNTINQTQIDALAAKFDAIYPLETNLLGYEYGGGSGGGGMDGDSHIQILVCDIDGDFGSPRNGVTLGYFYTVDEYAKTQYAYSNEAEIFYLDAEILDKIPDTAYSTLIHEFNHMINFNVKVLQQGNNWANWESWYTEMLSMLAEDAIGPLVGINGNVIDARIPDWLVSYASYGVMQWNDSNPLPYYSSNYAFGAYLVRNFGGPALLSAIAKSALGGEASLDAALRALNGAHVTARYALSRFGEALVYSGSSKPAGVYSFDNAVTGLIGSTSYTFPAFDIWITNQSGTSDLGPKIYEYNLNGSAAIPAKGLKMFSLKEWKSLTVQIRNGDPNIHYYVMIK
ncbi:MAG: hypothetical protein LBG27_02740 [Spirochaetaceae bacterium]|jgi:hypothetical protein|nr:hypothetical protein [Spirochaetaceae bacterium]